MKRRHAEPQWVPTTAAGLAAYLGACFLACCAAAYALTALRGCLR